jgi:hypothetical protein
LVIGGICIMNQSDATEFRPTLRLLFQARSAPLVSLTLQLLVSFHYALLYLRKVPWNSLWKALEHFSQLERISIGLSLSKSYSPFVIDEIEGQRMEAVVRDGCSGWIGQRLIVHFNMEI